MNFELYEVRIEDLYENHIAGMNPYNVAPWNIGWHPRYVSREFRNRYYYQRNSVPWPMSRRNMRRVHNPALWLPPHIREQNYRIFHQAQEETVKTYQDKTQYLMKLFIQLEANYKADMPLFEGDRNKEIDYLKAECFLVMAKFRNYGKPY